MGSGGKGGGTNASNNQVDPAFLRDHPGATNADFFGAVRAAEARNNQQAQFEQLFGAFGGGHKPKKPHEPGGGGQDDEARKKIEGENKRDDLFTAYLDAVEASTNTINSQIDEERSNALLLGIDFSLTDEDKKSRITSEFSDLFTTSQFDELNQLFKDFGDPEGFDGFSITPGEGNGTKETKQDTSKDIRDPKQRKAAGNTANLLSEDDTLGATSVLG